MAKTQYSLSDNPALLGAPTGFTITVSDIRVANGAGFIVCRTGDVMVMPGLPNVLLLLIWISKQTVQLKAYSNINSL